MIIENQEKKFFFLILCNANNPPNTKKILQIDKIESTLKCDHKNIISRNKGIIIQKMKSREI